MTIVLACDGRDGVGDGRRDERHRARGRRSEHLQGGQGSLVLPDLLKDESMVAIVDGGRLRTVSGRRPGDRRGV
jgi:hypothetical protein